MFASFARASKPKTQRRSSVSWASDVDFKLTPSDPSLVRITQEALCLLANSNPYRHLTNRVFGLHPVLPFPTRAFEGDRRYNKKEDHLYWRSNTFGYGVSTESSFVEVVEGLLKDVNTINLAVSGYSSYQGKAYLEKYLFLLKPDLVVASFNFDEAVRGSAGHDR
jgi:hypothetical protein